MVKLCNLFNWSPVMDLGPIYCAFAFHSIPGWLSCWGQSPVTAALGCVWWVSVWPRKPLSGSPAVWLLWWSEARVSSRRRSARRSRCCTRLCQTNVQFLSPSRRPAGPGSLETNWGRCTSWLSWEKHILYISATYMPIYGTASENLHTCKTRMRKTNLSVMNTTVNVCL